MRYRCRGIASLPRRRHTFAALRRPPPPFAANDRTLEERAARVRWRRRGANSPEPCRWLGWRAHYRRLSTPRTCGEGVLRGSRAPVVAWRTPFEGRADDAAEGNRGVAGAA